MKSTAPPDPKSTAAEAAEDAARASYGRLVASLVRRGGDIAAAEDALADAFAEALSRWPREGVPDAPAAWLLTVARRRRIDDDRRRQVRGRADVVAAVLDRIADAADGGEDDRLRLLLACAHPALDAAVRPALMLQVVLGVEVKTMASAFLLSPETLMKRLVRAKARIRENHIPLLSPDELDDEHGARRERLASVLEALYGAWSIGSAGDDLDDGGGDDSALLRRQALSLIELVVESMPDEPEALGLLALIDLCEARRSAQEPERFVPLLEQDPARWDEKRIERGCRVLERAASLSSPGPFQIEAAIQAAHCSRLHTGVVPWREIVRLYERLLDVGATPAAVLGLAVARCSTGDLAGARALLDGLPPDAMRSHQPHWVARSFVAEASGDVAEAARCLSIAVGLTGSPRRRRFLQAKLDALSSGAAR